jgi:hypothetical protein
MDRKIELLQQKVTEQFQAACDRFDALGQKHFDAFSAVAAKTVPATCQHKC